MNNDIIQRLKAPFPFDEVEAKIQVTSNDKTKGLAVFYLDARSVQERLDSALGSFDWRNEYIMWHGTSQICGLSIYNAERNEWVMKYDGAENSDIEAIKGGLTDAFKRAAVLWGIGRYLYQIDGIWVDVEQRGKGSFIKDNQMGKLKAEYDRAVARIFGSGVNNGSAATTPTPVKQALPPANKTPAPPASPPAAPTVQQPEPQGTSNPPRDEPPYDFKVRSIKPSGSSSQLLELLDPNGEITSGYIKNGDQAVVVGALLRGVQMERKTGSYGNYNLITAYKAA